MDQNQPPQYYDPNTYPPQSQYPTPPPGTHPTYPQPAPGPLPTDQLTHPVGGGTFEQAVEAARGGATVILALDNRPPVKLTAVELGAGDWMIVDPATNLPIPLVPEQQPA